jgi:hypothetical protein
MAIITCINWYNETCYLYKDILYILVYTMYIIRYYVFINIYYVYLYDFKPTSKIWNKFAMNKKKS